MAAVIYPVSKDKIENSTKVDNYCGIAISCVASKALERILLRKSSSCLHQSSKRQSVGTVNLF